MQAALQSRVESLSKTSAWEGEMVGEAFAEAQMVVREIPERRGAGQQAHPRVALQFGDGRFDPIGRCEAVDARSVVGEQRAAESRPLVAEDHARAAARRRERCRKARRARTDDQNLAVRVLLGVAIGVREPRRFAEARHAADQRLVEPVPGAARPHEGLVVEPGGQQRRKQFRQTAEVEAQARPAVLADRDQTIVELDLRRAQVRCRAGLVAAYRHECGRFLRPCGHDAARSVVFERAADEVHAVGEQGRGERVALETFVRAPIEAEADLSVAGDPAARQQACDAHRSPSGGFSPAL
jgi:hypothetical protein